LSYNAENLDSKGIVEALRRSRAVHINAFGSTLHLLARYMRDNDIENPGVRVLTTTGDNLSQEHRDEIESAFGVPVIDYFGAGGEGAHLASQCTQADRYHLHVENSVVEIIRDGRPAKPGEVGAVVFTQLDNRAMPLVRYDLGDLATMGDGELCPCGRAHPTIRAINGRACDVILTPRGGALLPQFFFIGPFKMTDHLRKYQVVQEELDRLVVKLVADPGCDKVAAEGAIREYISKAAEGSLKIDFEWVNEIPLTGLGKPRPVVSKISAGGLYESAEDGS
jgi:phenylacetate-CoA ligase